MQLNSVRNIPQTLKICSYIDSEQKHSSMERSYHRFYEAIWDKNQRVLYDAPRDGSQPTIIVGEDQKKSFRQILMSFYGGNELEDQRKKKVFARN